MKSTPIDIDYGFTKIIPLHKTLTELRFQANLGRKMSSCYGLAQHDTCSVVGNCIDFIKSALYSADKFAFTKAGLGILKLAVHVWLYNVLKILGP